MKEQAQERFVKTLGDDLQSGAWEKWYGQWRQKPYFEGSLRLIVSQRDGRTF